MTPDDLTAVAAANDVARRAEADDTVASDGSGTLARFRDHASGAQMGTNVSADKILAFDEAEEVLHARALSIRASGGDVERGLAAFAARPWSARREAFEDLWLDGRTAIYGALNTGGGGTGGKYGPFCLLVRDPDTGVSGLGLFPGDSAQRYTSEDGAFVDEPAAKEEATSWDHRSDLAVVERKGEALAVPPGRWFEVVCRPGHYLEAVHVGPLALDRMTSARLSEQYRRRLRRLRSRRARGAPLEPSEQTEADAYNVLARWRRTLSVAIEAVQES